MSRLNETISRLNQKAGSTQNAADNNPSSSTAGKPVQQKKMAKTYRTTRLSETISKFNQKAEDTQDKLDKNPFSDTYERPVHKVTDHRYGRPEAGSLTEKRGIKAGNHILSEIYQLCEVIDTVGEDVGHGMKVVNFGYLFEIYTNISNKVVGMLLRARKYNLVHFEGEMLYQRQDDHKVITLLIPLEEIRKRMKQSGDPKHCMAFDVSK